MNKYLMIVVALAMPILLIGAVVLDQERGPSKNQEAAKQVDIMRRVLSKGLNRLVVSDAGGRYTVTDPEKGEGEVSEAPPERANDPAAIATLYSALSSARSPDFNARGFLLPGHGAFFSLDVKVPTIAVKRKAKKKDGGKGAADDLWEEAKSEAEGRRNTDDKRGIRDFYYLSSGRLVGSGKLRRLDPRAIDKVVDKLVDLLARHGSRMTALDGDDHVIVAVTFTPGLGRGVAGTGRGKSGGVSDWLWASRGPVSQRVVARVRVDDLRRLGNPDLSARERREAMDISAYEPISKSPSRGARTR